MLEMYYLEDDEWLAKLYEERGKWALFYGRHAFYADLRRAQEKQSFNRELKKHLSPETDLLCFFDHYERMLDERRFAELQADVRANPNVEKFPSVCILKQAASAYTHAAFEMSEREFELRMGCMLYSCSEFGTISKYEVSTEERVSKITLLNSMPWIVPLHALTVIMC